MSYRQEVVCALVRANFQLAHIRLVQVAQPTVVVKEVLAEDIYPVLLAVEVDLEMVSLDSLGSYYWDTSLQVLCTVLCGVATLDVHLRNLQSPALRNDLFGIHCHCK